MSKWEELKNKLSIGVGLADGQLPASTIVHLETCNLRLNCDCPSWGYDKDLECWIPGFHNLDGEFEAFAA